MTAHISKSIALIIALLVSTSIGGVFLDVNSRLVNTDGRACGLSSTSCRSVNSRLDWSAVSYVIKFNGTLAYATIDDPGGNYYQVELDGQKTKVFGAQQGTQTYLLCNTTTGVHTVRLSKRTEASFGVVTVLGFEIEGSPIEPPSAPNRRLEFIGDSVTCGYGNLFVLCFLWFAFFLWFVFKRLT